MSDRAPPDGCGAPIRLEVVSLADAAKAPRCAKGTEWDGTRCAGNDGAALLPLLLLLGL